jgi:hypothetical protein
MRTASVAAVVAAMGLWSAPAWVQAQQRVQTDGRALDANPQVGSGGYNNVQNQVDYAARNAVITGDVAGGGQFRGRIDYGAPQSFRGQLGSDDNFRFYANSLPSALPLVNSGAATAGYGSAPIQVYRGQAGATLGSLSVTTDPYTVHAQGGGGSVLRLNDIGNASAYQSLAANAYRQTTTSALAIVPTSDGQLLEVSASPLLGMRQQRLTPDRLTPAADELTRTSTSTAPAMESPALDQRLDSQYRNPANPFSSDRDENLGADLGNAIRGWSPGLELSMQGTARLDGNRIGEPTERLDQRIARLEEAMLNPQGSRNAQPGADVYADLLIRVRGQTSVQVTQTAPVGAAGQTSPTAAAGSSQPGAASGGKLPTLEVPTLDQLREAEEARRDAERRMLEARGLIRQRVQERGAGSDAAQGDGAQNPGQEADGAATPDEVRNAEIQDRSAALTALMDKLAYDLPRLTTLAGERDSRLNELMRAAEDDLQRGKYFDAEGKYREATRLAASQPLTRVGLVHAQLGAGLVRSASVNLRNILQEHPELIATRYDPKLLPAQDRLDFVHAELQKAIESSDSAGAALLTAYLGYQLDSVPLIRYGLAMLEARAPQDPLIPLLRRIWLDETSRPAAATDRAPAQDK